jgi:SDR family mycofactocin-dependent oxidoreductase
MMTKTVRGMLRGRREELGRVEGKVALITGAARGQGRSHAVRLAEEGASIVAVDICGPLATTTYPAATLDDLDLTIKLVEAAGGQALPWQADVRDLQAMDAVVAAAVDHFGCIDVVVANAGIATFGAIADISPELWQEMLDVNLTGVWHTVKAATPPMVEADRGGSMILISSVGGLKGSPWLSHYVTAKHGVVGLMRALANELAPHRIRVNTVHPTGVATPMMSGSALPDLISRDPYLGRSYVDANALPVTTVEPEDVSNAVLWLASDEARYVTGATIPVDAGALVR